MTRARPSGGPLAGLRVIDLTVNVLGPVATQILGDMGADVIKIEEPAGDYTRNVGPSRTPGMGVFFLNINRNKRSVVLNLKLPAARDALMKLVAGADVFVHSMRPGAAKRLGISYEDVRAVKPDIVYASAGGFRPDSSRANDPAFDDVIQGMSGIAAMNGRQSGVPQYLPTVIADKFCGHVLASSVGMALLWRERTGEGQEVHVPMYETMTSFNLIEHLWGGVLDQPELGIGYARMLTPHRRPYPTSDGYICLLANTDAQWERMFAVMGRADLIGDPRFAKAVERSRNIDRLYAIVVEQMATRCTSEWHRLLDEADIPNGPMNDFDDLLADPYFEETKFFRKVSHPTEGRMMTMAVPVSYSRSGAEIRKLAPRLGEDGAAILAEIGLRPDAAAALGAPSSSDPKTSPAAAGEEALP
ncbi:CaiB/BaiF CoA transferase family protein [Tropicimonas isoalkanivorans]|uniref:Crotonobetainyl-CoA:carnitine CoA-transferase CaiB n=1 Tax=Tropicimonas isoalkanivorans TaxID=441112 RepID=A0A1I1HUL8_9RHOB|nr:CoA transferase [Tropicimonas isoalkanivorans]SFC27624.1 Crotonobetainyl-CoA:carnitine CoA-transferase CaiB [Tropicimonas isoalkanivorans]